MTQTPRKKKGMEPVDTRRSSGLFSFGADIRKLVEPLLGKKGLVHADILSHWTDILGPELACGITPFSVSFSKKTEGALLNVKAFSGAYAVEFTARKEQIKERLNSYFGYTAIYDIRVTQGGTFTPPEPTKKTPEISAQKKEEIHQIASEIETSQLREAVIQLGLLLGDSKKD